MNNTNLEKQQELERDEILLDRGNNGNGRVVPLKRVLQQLKSNAPLEVIKDDYENVVDDILKIAKLNKNGPLVEQILKVKKVLDSSEPLSIQSLIPEIDNINESIHDQIMLLVEQVVSNEFHFEDDFSLLQSQSATNNANHLQLLLKIFSSTQDGELKLLKEKGISSVDDFLKVSPLELSQVINVGLVKILEIKIILNEYNKLKEKKELFEKVSSIHVINKQMVAEVEKCSAANTNLVEINKDLRKKYEQILPVYLERSNNLKDLQSQLTTTQIECNRLAMEINFLQGEKTKLSKMCEEKHLLLGKLLARISYVKKSYEFVKGETNYSEDLLLHLDSLLNQALKQGKTLEKKLEDNEQLLESLLAELNDKIKKSKIEFYSDLKSISIPTSISI
ncbi:MAG: hypothetical protein HQK49_04545 [Oligoflexia bacterium]|nr:hypothetical protein [Oligoflexia bacterium]